MADVTHSGRARADYEPHVTPVTPAEDMRTILLNRVSWGAILAGVAVALVTQLLLNMIGIGIGFASIDPAGGDSADAETLSIGGALWWIISGIVAAAVGGFVAGRTAGQPKEVMAGLHGLASWAVTTLVVFWLLGSALGGVIGGAFRGISSAAGGVAEVAGNAAESAAPALASADPLAAIEREITIQTGGTDPRTLREAAVAAIRAAATGDQAQAGQARERAAQALAQSQGIAIEDARSQVDGYVQRAQQGLEEARTQVVQAADTAAEVASRAALYSALGLILGALAAWFAGRAGKVEPTITAGYRTTTTGPSHLSTH